MLITKEQTKYHNYALSFDYDQSVVEYCQYLKNIFGWTEFQFDPDFKRWRFKDLLIVNILKNKFSYLQLESGIEKDIEKYLQQKEEEKEKEQNAIRIKEAKVSNLEIKGIKGELYPYQKLGVEFFINSGGRAILADDMGCIGGDEKIIINRSGCARQFPIRYVFQKTELGNKNKNLFGNEVKSLPKKGWNPNIISKTRSLNSNGIFVLNEIKRVLFSGIKKTITITAKTNKNKIYKIRLTSDHKIATTDGEWKEAGLLRVSDTILVNGIKIVKKWCEKCKEETEIAASDYLRRYRPNNYGKCKKCIYRFIRNNNRHKGQKLPNNEHYDKDGYTVISGAYFHPSITRSTKKNKVIGKHILAYEAYLNNVDYKTWLMWCNQNQLPQKSIFIDSKKYAVHHKDKDKTNNKIENLELLTHSRHAQIEGKEYKFLNIKEFFVPQEAKIISIIESGAIDTYDIVMKDPDRNFVVSGIVVHNCGKSVQSLAYIVNTNQKRTLIICPASVKFSWKNECEKWTKLKPFVVDSKTKFADIPHSVDVVIINYDVLKKYFNELMKYEWSCLIADESHLIKNVSAIRSRAVKAIAKNIPSVLLLSGTPLINRPIELFNLLNIIDPKSWQSWYQYAVRYADGKRTRFGFEANGATNLSELKQKIERYFLRRTKDEVLPQLPPKIKTEIPVELVGEFGKQYKTAASDLARYLKQYKNETDVNILKTIQSEKLTRINYLRQISSMGKVSVAKELIQSIIDGGEKVIVFSCFNAPLLELQKTFREQSVMIIGKTNVNDRGDIVKKFQEDSNIKIFFGGVNSAGSGITLTAASHIIFIDYSWTPGDMRQAQDRAHRPGAVYESLNIYQITSKGTIDDFMKKLLIEKQEIFDKLFEGKQEKKQRLILDEITDDIEKNY